MYESEEEVKQLLKNFRAGLDSLRKEGTSVESILSDKNASREVADYNKQIQRLEDTFCTVTDKEYCKEILRNVTYYRLKGYFWVLLEENGGDRMRVKFEDAVSVYDFDAKLRAVLLYALWKIEIYLAAQFVQYHTETYKSPFSYLDWNAYGTQHNHRDFLNCIQRAVRNNQEAAPVEHYLKHHGGIMPFWTVSQLLTFGNLRQFYEDLRPQDQSALLKRLYAGAKIQRWQAAKAKETGKGKNAERQKMRVFSWLDCCGSLRNVCAHNGRFYGRGFAYTPVMPKEFNQFANEKKLWAPVLSVRFLYPDDADWNQTVFPQMRRLFESYREQWGNTAYGKLLNALGFPSDWTDVLQTW